MKILLILVLALFSAYTGWVAWEFGYLSVFEVSLREHPSTQAIIDLWIACGLLFLIIFADHLRSGRPLIHFVPFAIVTSIFGAIGPLLYFICYSDLLKWHTPRVVLQLL